MDPFAFLGLEPSATEVEVRAAYRAMARSLHPDAGGTARAFYDLNEAYRQAVKLAAERSCPTCMGSGRITHTSGWSSISLACPSCGVVSAQASGD